MGLGGGLGRGRGGLPTTLKGECVALSEACRARLLNLHFGPGGRIWGSAKRN